jgi:hypothetical protein
MSGEPDIHPDLLIKDHEQGPPFALVFLAVDEPKGGPPLEGVYSYDSPDTDLHIRSFTHLHMRSSTDNGIIISLAKPTAMPLHHAMGGNHFRSVSRHQSTKWLG